MTLGQGWAAHVVIGDESAWGTAVIPDEALEIVGFRGGLTYPQLQEDTFRGLSIVEFFRGAQGVEIELETELRYEGYELLWYFLFGKVTTNTVNLIKEHTFEFDDTAAEVEGITLECKYGDGGTLRFEGCKVDSAEITYEIDKISKVRWTLVGETASGATAVTPTFPTSPRMRWNEFSFEQDDAVKGLVGATVRISNNYLRDRRELGSLTVLEPVRQGRTVEGTVRGYLDGLAIGTNFYNKMANDATIKFEFNSTSPTSIPTSSPTDYYDMLLTIPFASIVDFDVPVNDRGPLIEEANFVAKKDTSEVASLIVTGNRATVP